MNDLLSKVSEADSIEELKACLVDIVLELKVTQARHRIVWNLVGADAVMDLQLKDNVTKLLELARAREAASMG